MHLHRDRGELDYIIGEVAKPLVGFHCQMDENREGYKRCNDSDVLNLSLESNRFSRDLLHRFMESGSSRQKEFVKREEEEEEEDLELNLGLSLGGRFGVDKTKLVRSSSIASLLPVTRDDDALTPPATVYPPLARTSSLPVETEEEWRKRKEMQSLRRMEAKRRRFEKQRNVRAEREAGVGGCGSDGGGGGGSSGSGGVDEERKDSDMNSKQQFELLAAKKFETSVPSPCRLNKLNGALRQASLGSGIDLEIAKGKGSFVGAGGGSNGGQPLRQGSIESQGGSVLSISAELESKPLRGSSSGSDMSPASSRKSRPGTESPAKGTDIARNRNKETGTQEIQDMPCVFTKGDGPNGRRVDGILYKYGKGEEVKIMCVCHGCFLSPAEFVKHAGLINVSHPLKHIVIVPNHPSF